MHSVLFTKRKTEGEHMGNTRTDLFSLVKSLRENNLITESDANVFKDVITKTDLEDYAAVEDMILEAAENMSNILVDLKILAEAIYPTFQSYKRALKFGRELTDKLSVIKLEGFDVFEVYSQKNIYKVPKDQRHKLLVFHVIVNVEHNGTSYGFGFNKSQKAVSYKVGDKGPLFDNISNIPEDYEEVIMLISYLIQYVMDIV
jgi:hypothetical protein